MNWLKKVWNKGFYRAEDGYKFGSRSRIERRAIKQQTKEKLMSDTTKEKKEIVQMHRARKVDLTPYKDDQDYLIEVLTRALEVACIEEIVIHSDEDAIDPEKGKGATFDPNTYLMVADYQLSEGISLTYAKA